MNFHTHLATRDWDKDIDREELLARLDALADRAGRSLPILDDGDLEAAIDEAADRLAPD
jgi:hypothetical protein